MAAVTTVRDVLYSYGTARYVYERFINECDCHPQMARNAIALLLCFDHGTNQVITHLSFMNTVPLGRVLAETCYLIDCLLRMRNNQGGPSIPLLSALCQDGRMNDPLFLTVNRQILVRAVAGILDGVCTLVFDDRLYRLLLRYQTGLFGRFQELEAPYTGAAAVAVPEDCRSMFVTFAKGQAVEREDIFNYFRENCGDCIVRVLIEKTTGGAQPMYGRVIFKSKGYVSIVLNGAEHAWIFIRGREIWLREYIPRSNGGGGGGGSSSQN